MCKMSKEYCCFEYESGQTSFLAGIVDVLSDNLSIYCSDFNTMDADIFYIPNQNVTLLNNAVKNRVRRYYSLLGGLNKPAGRSLSLYRASISEKPYKTGSKETGQR